MLRPELKMRNPFSKGRQKLNSTTTTTTSTGIPSPVLGSFLACFTPLGRRKSTIFHHNSVSIAYIIEENERRTSIDDLPDSLLVEILHRLPLNHVFRSKGVCNKWLTLISDPFFARSYAIRKQQLPPQFALFYINCTTEPEYPCGIGPFSPPPTDPHHSITFPLNFFTTELQQRQKETPPLQLIGSDRNLLLFTELRQYYGDSYSVCNPLTFEWINISDSPRYIRYPVVGFMVEENGTFWIVEIRPPINDVRQLVFLVFCSVTGKWVSKNVTCPRPFELFSARTTVVHQGIIFWIVDTCLLAFDPKNGSDQCYLIDLPNDDKGRCGVSCGRLHYYQVSSYNPGQTIETPIMRVWEMIDFETGQWVLLHCISHRHLCSSDEHLKQFLLVENMDKYFRWVSVNPSDSDVVFLKCDRQLVTCKLSSACLEVVPCDAKQGIFYRLELYILPLVFQPWPTSLAQNEFSFSATSEYDTQVSFKCQL